jgi:hypothetical protein
MKIENIKEEVILDMEKSQKKNKQKHEIQWKAIPAD